VASSIERWQNSQLDARRVATVSSWLLSAQLTDERIEKNVRRKRVAGNRSFLFVFACRFAIHSRIVKWSMSFDGDLLARAVGVSAARLHNEIVQGRSNNSRKSAGVALMSVRNWRRYSSA